LNPFIHATVRDSSPAEVEALHQVCEQLAGFNPDIHLEWVDGFLTSMAAGPRLPEAEVWLAALCGDAFDRAFADPADRQRAQRVLQTRLKVLCEQLNPEQLLDSAQNLRLSPLMMEWSDADRDKLLQEGTLPLQDVPVLVTGAEWALGFIDGTEAFADDWLGPLDEASAEARDELLDQLVLLFAPADEPERAELLARYHPAPAGAPAEAYADAPAEAPEEALEDEDGPQAALEEALEEAPSDAPLDNLGARGAAVAPSHDELITEALFAVQDLRIFWLDHAPKPVTRRVAAEPGRNDACPCGSGKKYKKCHGAASA